MASEVDISNIVKGLSEAQRRALRNARHSQFNAGLHAHGRRDTMNALFARGLVIGGLTPLGEAVRSHLIEKDGQSANP